jgi:hypothetical protein
MRFSFLGAAALLASHALASVIPNLVESVVPQKRADCDNTATSRDCWGEYDLSTNWYSTIVSTGVTREASAIQLPIPRFKSLTLNSTGLRLSTPLSRLMASNATHCPLMEPSPDPLSLLTGK